MNTPNNKKVLTKQELKGLVVANLPGIIADLNMALTGKTLEKYESTLVRLGRGGNLPHWFDGLRKNGRMPNFDGKSVGSILEMVFVAVMEHKLRIELRHDIPLLRINPARGIDLPDLDLGIKSPSKNYCTSEPFFSAYERLYGNECDALILLTDYQEAKTKKTETIQVIGTEYLRASEIADSKLCRLALKSRNLFLETDKSELQRLFCFLAYVNQSDWRAVQILKLIEVIDSKEKIIAAVTASLADFDKQNRNRIKKGAVELPEYEKAALEKIIGTPDFFGVVNAASNWLVDVLKEAARSPSSSEWARLETGPLDGKIGMSFALQWRYNFGSLFKEGPVVDESQDVEVATPLDLDEE